MKCARRRRCGNAAAGNAARCALFNALLDRSRKAWQAYQTTSYVLNALSRTRAISQPVLVSPTLVRFSISQYAPRQEEFAAWFAAWEKLVEFDPYFHLRTEVALRRNSEGGRRKRPELVIPPSAFPLPP